MCSNEDLFYLECIINQTDDDRAWDIWQTLKSSELAKQSPNTGSPKLPTWEETYKWAYGSHGAPDLDQGQYAILRGCYEFICRQLRAGA
jgi:hypothetical protein